MFILFKTVDGGATWQGSTIVGDRDAQDVFFIDANTGYVRTGYPDTGRLFRTTDGGRTFTGVGASPGDRMKFTDPGVGWSFYYGKLNYTSSGGDRWTSRSFTFPATVYSFSLPSRRRAYVVGNHGMVYRYSIVPASFTAPGMIDAPAMPGYDLPVAAEVQKLQPAIAALQTDLQAAVKAAGATGAAADPFQNAATNATGGGFVQDATAPGTAPAAADPAFPLDPTAQPFIQDTGFVTAPGGPGVSTCCVMDMQVLQNSFNGFSQNVPTMVTRYRGLNLLLAAFQLFSDLPGHYQGVTNSFKALKSAPDPQAASTALSQFSSELNQMAQSAQRTLQAPPR